MGLLPWDLFEKILTPNRRIFFRRAALKNLGIHRVFLRFFVLPGRNLSPLGILPIFKQTLSEGIEKERSLYED